jgi:hypothetical protein
MELALECFLNLIDSCQVSQCNALQMGHINLTT